MKSKQKNRIFWTNRGGELFLKEFNLYSKKNGIRHQFTHVRSPIHNVVVKQKNH